MHSARTFGVIGIKGGVGKTCTATNLGAAFAAVGKKTLLVDANITAGDLGVHFGMTQPQVSIQDVLLGKRSAASAIIKLDERLHLLLSSPVHQHVDTLRLRHCLEELKPAYDIILLDSSPTLNHELLGVMLAADELLVVSTPDRATAHATAHATSMAKRRDAPIAGIILNQHRDKPFEVTLDELEAQAETPVLSVIPHDHTMAEAVAHTMPAARYSPQSEAAIAYQELAACLLGETFSDPRWSQRAKRFFFDETRKDHHNREQYRKRMK